MKKILLLLFALISIKAVGQSVYKLQQDSIRLGNDAGTSSVTLPGGKLYIKGLPKGNLTVKGNGQVVHNDTVYATAASTIINGFTVYTAPTIGQVIPTGTPEEVFKALFSQTQPPTATLSGGTVYELTTSNKTHNLSFSYGRQANTATISTAVINPGSLNVYSTQPAQPGTVSGTQSVTTTANTNTTYTLTVTTSETPAKTTTATTTDTFLPGRYWGRSSISTPSNGVILAVAGGDKQLNGSKANSGFTVTASGSNYVFYAYPSSLGDLTSLTVGGFASLPAFTKTVISLTNVEGFTQNYNVYTSNNTFSANTPAIVTQ